MPALQFLVADPRKHRKELIELNLEYMTWVCQGLEAHFGVAADAVLGMPVADYVPMAIDKVCGDLPPKGVFYLALVDGALAGMGGLRYVRAGASEIKRIYFRPAFRGKRLGERMLTRLLADASAFGYTSALLDSGPFMASAHRLYAACGFVDCPAYAETEVPPPFRADWRFMRKAL